MNMIIMMGRLFTDNFYSNKDGKLSVCSNTLMCKDTKTDGVASNIFMEFKLWGKCADNFAKFTEKDDEVVIIGKIKQETWTDSNGKAGKKIYISASEFQIVGKNKSVVSSTQSNFTKEEVTGNFNYGADANPFEQQLVQSATSVDKLPF